MKVIIADDEIHICSLIKHVIDWDGLGLELLGVFHDGDSVVAQFEVKPADILICDIEMPGMSGTDLIKHISEQYPNCRCMVVSGFRNFEYARAAMQYGVTNYLLKPIDPQELNAALSTMLQSSQSGPAPSSIFGEQSIRLGLIDTIRSGLNGESMDSINTTYHYHFCEGMFGMLKTVFTGIEFTSDPLPRIMSVFNDTIKQRLLSFCSEAEVFRLSPVSSVAVFNLQNTDLSISRSILESSLRNILRNILIDIGGKMPGTTYYIGVGELVNHIGDLKRSWDTADYVLCDRFRMQDQHIFYAKFVDPLKYTAPAGIKREDRRTLANLFEAIDMGGIQKWLESYFAEHQKTFEKEPYMVIEFSYAVVDVMLHTFDDLDVPVGDKELLRLELAKRLDNSRSMVDVQKALFSLIEEQMNSRMQDKHENMTVYAQQTKNYIERHYAESVTLERIADKLHINPVYLSVVFKSETGMNYSKYLTGVRIEKSKELLRNHDLTLSQVANAVGYDSTSYFSSLFRKYTGLRPSEYRRLHQHDIGD